MAKRPETLSPWVHRGLYGLAILLVFWPLVDLTTNLWPVQPGNFRWRYGFAGLLGGFHLTPMFGFVLAMFVGIWMEQPRALRTLSVLGFAAAAFLVVIMIIFPLDTLQVRAERDPGVLPAVIAGAVIAEGKHFTTFVVLSMLSLGAWKSSARVEAPTGSGGKAKSKPKAGVLIAPDGGTKKSGA